ncbi:kinesin heavy chain-like isoform X2 [Lethenteron reissneri]|uniref:kinesin heavy chain-like isoform X2 n=1 Tax=Lethenteron reissneri TaxID=7753 RepID=UPI002AB7AD59|nr:kinesin heavy chain-like isoform X2 [Lethenteron reissneri]
MGKKKMSTFGAGGKASNGASKTAFLTGEEHDSDNEETELRALRQSRRALEGAHRSYARDSEVAISRQQQQIRQLELERENLKLALGVAEGRQSKDRATSLRRVSLLRKQEDTEALIAQEKARQQQIDRQIKTTMEEVRKVQRPTDEEEDMPKKMQTLTSQVEKAEGKFSSLLTHIAESRKEIETMRWERDRFHKVLQKLQKELDGLKRETSARMDAGKEVFQSWREATEELDRRRRSAAVERERREGQQREQSRGADAASRLDAFLLDKNKRRQADELWLRARSKRESSLQRQRAEGFETLCEYEAAVAQVGKIIAEREAHEDVAKTGGEANVKLAGVSVDKPRDGPFPGGVAVRRRGSVAPVHGGPTPVRRRASVMLTEPAQGSTPLSLGEEARGPPARARHHRNGRASWSNDLRLNADFIHDTYVDRENANFALFNYVTEQECEIRKLKDDIEKLSADMEPRGGGPEGTSDEREKSVRVNICKVTSEKEMSEKKRADAERTLGKLKEGVWNLLMKMDCNLEELKQGLAWKEGVTDQNIAAYLILIKQEASRLLSARDYLQSKIKATEPLGKLDTDNARPVKNSLLDVYTMELPSTTLDWDSGESSEEGSDLKPLEVTKQ